MKNHFFLNQDEIDTAKEMYRDGHLIGHVAAKLGISRKTAQNAIGATRYICQKEHEENRQKIMGNRKYKRQQKCTPELRKHIAQDYLTGVPCAQILYRHNISESTLNYALHTYARENNVVIYKRRPRLDNNSSLYGDMCTSKKVSGTRYQKEKTKTDPSSNLSGTREDDQSPHRHYTLGKNTDAYWDSVIADISNNPYACRKKDCHVSRRHCAHCP